MSVGLHPLEMGALGVAAEPYNSQVQQMQKAVNQDLTALGYNPIGADGKLGNETCGAISWLVGNGYWQSPSLPGNCVNYSDPWAPTPNTTPPAKQTPPAKTPPASTTTTSKAAPAAASGGGGAVVAVLLGGALGLGALAVWSKRHPKKRR